MERSQSQRWFLSTADWLDIFRVQCRATAAKMGGSVSSGRDNTELVDNLKSANYIRSPHVEAAFRAVDRADFMPPDFRNLAYKDLAWRNGQLHLSAPCIYSEVMEGLDLNEGLTFLNVGSGTGYLSTMVGLLLGARGVNHGIEIQGYVLHYASTKLAEFLANSPAVDEFHFCIPTFVHGNGLCLPPGAMRYDRVYCGASCPEEYSTYFKHLINVGGVLVMPLNDNLLQVRRLSETEWTQRSLLSVSFASLLTPTNTQQTIKPPELWMSPPPLQVMVRSVIRRSVQREVLARNPELKELPQRPPPVKKQTSRRICLPIEYDSDLDLDSLHDLEDRASGSAEMNALLSLVFTMGQSRAAGALRFDTDGESGGGGSSGSGGSSDSDSVYSNATLELAAPRSDEEAVRDDSAAADKRDAGGEQPSSSHAMETIPLGEPRGSGAAAAEPEEDAPPDCDRPSDSSGTDNEDLWWRERCKRNKLDSGIGEENSPKAADGAPADSPNRMCVAEDFFPGSKKIMRRLNKRRRPPPAYSSGSSRSSSPYSSPSPRRHKKCATPDLHRVRRDHISRHMQRAIALLPLPPPLQFYVNLERPMPN